MDMPAQHAIVCSAKCGPKDVKIYAVLGVRRASISRLVPNIIGLCTACATHAQ